MGTLNELKDLAKKNLMAILAGIAGIVAFVLLIVIIVVAAAASKSDVRTLIFFAEMWDWNDALKIVRFDPSRSEKVEILKQPPPPL